MFILKIFYFFLLMIVSDLCLKWVWKAVYRSAYKREEDVERYRNLNATSRHADNTTDWVINSSPNPYKTLTLVILFYAGLLPAVAGQFLVLFSLLSSSMERVVDIFAVALPVLCVVYLIAGFIYTKTAKEPDYDKFSKKHITNYDSQRLADYAEDWETGEYKSKSRILPSRLPQIFIIIAMITVFAATAISASLNGGRINLSSNEMQEYRDILEEQGVKINNRDGVCELYDYLIDGFYFSTGDILMDVYLYDNAENALFYGKQKMEDEDYIHYTEGECEIFMYRLVHRYIICICRDRYVAEINCSIDNLAELNKLLRSIDFCEIKEGR